MIGLVENRRIMLLATLLASALIAAALITALVPTAAAPTSRGFRAILKDGVVELYRDGELVKTIKAPEGAKSVEVFTSEAGGIYFKFEVELPPSLGKDLKEKAIEIIKNSPRVQEVIGNDYEIVAVGFKLPSSGGPVIVVVKASDGTCYRLTVDLDQGAVESIEKAEVCRIELTSRTG